jgi:hypothetical protein
MLQDPQRSQLKEQHTKVAECPLGKSQDQQDSASRFRTTPTQSKIVIRTHYSQQ